jgi:hypothetical protein
MMTGKQGVRVDGTLKDLRVAEVENGGEARKFEREVHLQRNESVYHPLGKAENTEVFIRTR